MKSKSTERSELPGTLADRARGVRPRLREEVRHGEERMGRPLANQTPSCFEDWLQEGTTEINSEEQPTTELITVSSFIRSIHKNTHHGGQHCCLPQRPSPPLKTTVPAAMPG